MDPREKGRIGGLRSAEVRRDGPKGRRKLDAKVDELFDDLFSAAKGQNGYADLPVDKRFAALKLALEYAVGKPRPMDREVEDEDGDEETEGGTTFSFEIGPPSTDQPPAQA